MKDSFNTIKKAWEFFIVNEDFFNYPKKRNFSLTFVFISVIVLVNKLDMDQN